jgi:hypothetical protein
MLSANVRIVLLAAGLGFLLLASGCKSQSSPEEAEGGVATLPASAASGGVGVSGGFRLETAMLDGGADADAGLICGSAGDPTLGIDAGSSCTGALAQATFTYGLCACGAIQASNAITTDGYDSTKGAPDGGLGGNVGANTGVSWSTASSIGGNLWTPGNVTSSNPSVVRGDLHLGGTLGGGAALTVDGNAFDVHTLPGNAKVLGTVSKVKSVAAPCDCSNLVPVASITAAHRATNNDDATIGLSPTVAVGNNPARVDLPCGNYYLSQVNAAQPLTIAVHGHTALYVDGNLNAGGALTFQVDPTATLDLFVAGTFNASNGLTLGSTADPAHCRAYVAGTSFTVSGSATLGCNVYAPNALVTLANGSTAFGSIFGKTIQANGNATVHYDTSVTEAAGECCSAGTCDDGNPCTVDACNGDGTCSHTAAANGASCSGTNQCEQAYTCQAGACIGSDPVVCSARDACHLAGTCDPASGACSNPTAANGTSCNDGNACTQSDTCESGTCTGSSPVTCTAEDGCHTAGTCDSMTGACTNPVATNGTSCSDGNACTQADTCENGTCTGSNPVVCAASDACHVGGTCNPSTGACTNPVAANGTGCNDGNACTQSDSCQNGACTGSNPVTCTASDACHVAGACDPGTGACTNPVAANGTSCSDGNACTQADSCQSGTCTGSNAVTCTASDACHVAGACDPTSGSCSNPVAANGTTCSDGNACTQSDACQNGKCAGTAVACTASDSCHIAGACDPTSGACSNPPAPNGTTCNDGNACTQTDICTAGVCTGTSPVVCAGPHALLAETTPMSTPRSEHASRQLASGDVLVAGGTPDAEHTALATTEIYRVATATWSPAKAMSVARYGHAATRLANGRILVAGGTGTGGDLLASAEIYDSAADTWMATGPMNAARAGVQAALLADGRVLVIGTPTGSGPASEVFYPVSGTWSPGQGADDTLGGDRVLIPLTDGRAVATGASLDNAASIFDPQTNAWTHVAPMPQIQGAAVGALLPTGSVLIAGGRAPKGGALGADVLATLDETAGGVYEVRARWWSPEMGTFLSLDNFNRHSSRTTLWGWPGSNPIRFRRGPPRRSSGSLRARAAADGPAPLASRSRRTFPGSVRSGA